jgi:hypothetical protein
MGDGGVWGGMSEDMGLEGGLYTQGEAGQHFFGAGGLSKRISEKGRCESDPMVDKKRERSHNSIRAPVAMQSGPFFFLRNPRSLRHGAANAVRNPHTHVARKSVIVPCLSWPILCSSATESVAGTERLPHTTSELRCHVHTPPALLMSSAPTTRSRTLLFLSYRDSRASSSTSHHRYALDNDGDENERLIDPTKDHIAIDVGLPPKWSGHPRR